MDSNNLIIALTFTLTPTRYLYPFCHCIILNLKWYWQFAC